MVQSLATKRYNHLWSTLDVDSHKLWTALHLSDDDFSLKILVERKLDDFRGKSISIDEDVWDVLLVVYQELNEAYFYSLTSWLIFAFLIIGLDSDVGV